jgi:hypothetical protein
MKRRIAIVTLGVLVLAWLAGVLIGPQAEPVPAAAPVARTPLPTLAPTGEPTRMPTATLPTIGAKVAAGNWEIEVMRLDTAARIGRSSAQGVFAIFTVSARNLRSQASTIHEWDFEVQDAQGRTFKPSTAAAAALLDTPGPVLINLSGDIQPSLAKTYRVAFDLNPSLSGYVLRAAAIPFRFSLP